MKKKREIHRPVDEKILSALLRNKMLGGGVLWEPYPSHHNGLFSLLLVLRDFAARGVDQSRSEPLQLPGSTSAGRVICGTNLAECISAPGDFIRPQGAFPPGFYPLRWGHRSAPEAALIRGMPTGPLSFLEMPGACGLRPCARAHLKKGLVPHLPVRWGEQQIPQIKIGVIRTVRDFLPFLCNSIFLV